MAKQNAVGVPLTLDTGGTGSIAFTAGSVVFSDGSILTQDNSNLFWDDTNNRLGIGTTTPLDELHVVGAMDLVHTAAMVDDHALELDVNAAGFGDVKALDIAYTTGALAAGEDEAIILINIDESLATGGEIYGIEVLSTTEGTDAIVGYKSGIGIDALHQHTGTFGNADGLLNKAVDVTAALASGGAGNISIFVADNDTFTIRDAATWDEGEFLLDTVASGGGVAPTFAYSTGGAAYTAFVPIDGTNGFKNTGIIDFNSDDLAGWATATSGDYEIVITRTKNSLSTTPILDTFQLSSVTEHKWDKDGGISAASLTLTTDLAVADGGSGRSTGGVAYSVICAGTTATGVQQNVAALGAAGTVLTSAGAGALPSFATPTAATDVSDATFRIQDDGDDTKEIAFEASSITGSTTRTITMPDADITLLIPSAVAITGGAIDGTTIGGTTPAAGTFDDLTLDDISGSYADAEQVFKQAGVQTTDATVTAAASITLATNTMVTVEARFNGFINDYSASCGGRIFYTARRVAGGAVEVGTPIVDVIEDSASAPTVDADVSGNDVRLLVTGVAAETWNWVVTYNYNFTKTNA